MKLYRAHLPEHRASCKSSGRNYFAADIDNAAYWTCLVNWDLEDGSPIFEIWEYDIPEDTPAIRVAGSWDTPSLFQENVTLVGDVDFTRWTYEGEIVTPYNPDTQHPLRLVALVQGSYDHTRKAVVRTMITETNRLFELVLNFVDDEWMEI